MYIFWDWTWNLFYGNSFPSQEGNLPDVSYMWKNVYWVLVNSFHQRAEIFWQSRGTQCTANALVSLIYANYSNFPGKTDLNNILIDGDTLYCKIVYDLSSKAKYSRNVLNFDKLPHFVAIICNIISGLCTEQFGEFTLPTLHQTLYTDLCQSPDLLLMIGSICSSVFKKNDKYCFFDSHSHGLNGLSA